MTSSTTNKFLPDIRARAVRGWFWNRGACDAAGAMVSIVGKNLNSSLDALTFFDRIEVGEPRLDASCLNRNETQNALHGAKAPFDSAALCPPCVGKLRGFAVGYSSGAF